MKTKMTNIEPGTTIHTEKPFVHLLNSKFRTERCDQCLQSTKLLKCSVCQSVYYCSRVCQKESWPIHKSECPGLKRLYPRVLPDTVRFLARIIIKLQHGGDMEKAYYTPTCFRKFKDLMSHYSDIKEDPKRMEHFAILNQALHLFLTEILIPNSAELLGIFGRMTVNSFHILDPEMNGIGSGLYLGASVIDHSCKPNAIAIFEGTKIIIRNLEFLPTLDWSQIYITYVDLLNTTEQRQKDLQSIYYFLCSCSLCLDTNHRFDMDSAICPNAQCRALVRMKNSKEISCTKCNLVLSDEFKKKYSEAEEFTQLHLEEMQNIAYLDVCKICLKQQEGLFHSLNLLYVKTLDLALESSLQLKLWDEVEEYGLKLIPGYIKYYGASHSMVGLLHLKVAQTLLFKNKEVEAFSHFLEATKILRITHGENHTLFKQHINSFVEHLDTPHI